jgi:hypothetical protein
MWGAFLVAGSVSLTIAFGLLLSRLALGITLGLVPPAGRPNVAPLED